MYHRLSNILVIIVNQRYFKIGQNFESTLPTSLTDLNALSNDPELIMSTPAATLGYDPNWQISWFMSMSRTFSCRAINDKKETPMMTKRSYIDQYGVDVAITRGHLIQFDNPSNFHCIMMAVKSDNATAIISRKEYFDYARWSYQKKNLIDPPEANDPIPGWSWNLQLSNVVVGQSKIALFTHKQMPWEEEFTLSLQRISVRIVPLSLQYEYKQFVLISF